MNTAKTWVNRRSSISEKNKMTVSRLHAGLILLIFALLLTAFGLVYVKDLHRRLFLQYQTLQKKQNQLQLEWGKLLLEKGAWAAQARIQRLAEHRLNMISPTARDIILVERQ